MSSSALLADQASNTKGEAAPMPMGVTSQPKGVITPPVAPRVTHGADVFVTADFIYWKARQDGLEYAASGVASSTFPTLASGLTIPSGHVKEPKFEFQPGFKIGLGILMDHDGWDLYANYTWLNPQQEKNEINLSSDTNATLVPLRSNGREQLGAVQLTESESWYKLNYNVIDLELGRNFFVSRYLTMRPHVGLKTAWLRQKFNMNEEISVDSLLTVPGTSESKQKQNTWGLGIRGGINTVYHFNRNWGIYGDLALSALWSCVKVKNHTEVASSGFAHDADVIRNRRGFHEVMPVLELGLGLEYMTWFYNENYMLSLQAGWEEQVWFNTNHFFDPQTHLSGNLTVQGFTFKVGFYF
ncbi:MAG: hypothetical protein JSS61_06560 [Verrucomicrobia bacterium]|nr:hypothetical protein [Verrucomicrobiota bacterium]